MGATLPFHVVVGVGGCCGEVPEGPGHVWLGHPTGAKEGAYNFLMSFEAVSSQTAEMKGLW